MRRARRLLDRLLRLVAAGVCGSVLGACGAGSEKASQPGASNEGDSVEPRGASVGEAPRGLFRDVTKESGLATFRLENGARGERWLVETMTGGLGFIDFDNDGDLDLWVANAHERSLDPTAPGTASDRLFENDGRGRFTDVTERAGVRETRYSNGVAVGDFDNDGLQDVFVTSYGRNTLFRNTGEGSFVDVTESAGLVEIGWSMSAAWFDMDRDGDLDLYVTRYLEYQPGASRSCVERGERVYCHPRFFRGEPDLLYENLGDGTFREIGKRAGIARAGPEDGKGLGVVAFDFDGDRLVDVYVANDTTPNFLWKNLGDGTFREVAFEVGVAVDENGQALAGMGVDIADIDGDLRLDIAVTNFAGELNSLYLARTNGEYSDSARSRGLATSHANLGFGTALADFDLDGHVDHIVANGHVDDLVESISQGRRLYQQEISYYRGAGKGRFAPATPEETGPALATRAVGRGLATADIDGDGDLDVAISTIDRGLILLENATPADRRRLAITLRGGRSGRDAYNARVTVEIGGHRRAYEAQAARSYLSSCDPRIFVGLGEAERADRIVVHWPSGAETTRTNVEPGAIAIEEP